MAKKTAGTVGKKNTKKSWGFDVKELDPSVRPQDDFYNYVNGKWRAANQIPASESRWGSFMKLRFDTDHILHSILKELDTKKSLKGGTPEQMIRDFYRSGMDMKRRNMLDAKPVEEYRKKVQSINSVQKLQAVIAELHRIGVGGAWAAGVGQDSKSAERYILHFYQDGLGMPDREYYLKDDAESVRVRTAYVAHVERLFKLMGRTTAQAKEGTATLMEIETALAKASMKKEDLRDPHKTYHKIKVAKLQKIAPQVDWREYLKRTDGAHVEEVIVMQPEFMTAVAGMVESVPLEKWREYLEWHLVSGFSSLLSDKFIKETFSFYGTVLIGTRAMKPLWRRVLGNVNGHLGELLAQIYIKKYFGPEAKKKMNTMVDNLIAAYERRIKAIDWMGDATKKKAVHKLHSLNRKIGYPDHWRSYTGLEIKQNEYVGNVIRTSIFDHKYEMKRLKKPVQRWEWHMYPQEVNAYFAPNLNDIVFPAGILQPPFFYVHGDDAYNYGCMGSVIGHEMTHGFDDEGAQYDHKGNLKSWWSLADRKHFEDKSKVVEEQFNSYTVADGLHVNGKLTMGENIADLGGLAIAYDALQMHLDTLGEETAREEIDGLTSEQRFFIGFAIFERENARPEFEKWHTLNDPHSPGRYRINGPLSNSQKFYDAWGVKKGDKLYREPKDRATIW